MIPIHPAHDGHALACQTYGCPAYDTVGDRCVEAHHAVYCPACGCWADEDPDPARRERAAERAEKAEREGTLW